MMKISVSSRAHRTLRDTPRFHFFKNEPEIAAKYCTSNGAGSTVGKPIGVYLNPPSVQPREIAVAEGGLVLLIHQSERAISFSEISAVLNPSAQSESSEIRLTLQSGEVVQLNVAGTDGRFRDVFAFARFLDRVLEDRTA